MIHRRPGSAVVAVPFATMLAMALVGCGSAPLPSPSSPAATPVLATATPGLSPEPTFQSTSQPTLQPPILPSALPATPPAPSTDPVFGDLLPHVPEAIRGSCQETVPLEPVTAMVSCSPGDGEITVDYLRYPDRDSMYAAYNERVRVTEIERDSGRCYVSDDGSITASPGRWPSEQQYSVGGQQVGRYLCLGPPPEFPSINWTDDRLMIMAVASSGPAFVDRLVAFWLNEAGPVP